jgi:hypothetical protein
MRIHCLTLALGQDLSHSLATALSVITALARLGAFQLQESTDTLPSERLTDVGDVLREASVASEFPRLITALAPVLVSNIGHVNLNGDRQVAEHPCRG